MKILRNKLVLIGAVCAAPVVIGWLVYLYGWVPAKTGNYGELIAPIPLSATPLDALRGKWVLISFDAARCEERCEKKLYFMRQLRRAQGKDMGRIERLWVLTDAARPRPELLAAIEGTRTLRADELSSVLKSFPGEFTEHLYLVDPLGNLMMRFPRDPDPSKMLKDLQRLLKYSRTG